jgi:hypothetical protein
MAIFSPVSFMVITVRVVTTRGRFVCDAGG